MLGTAKVLSGFLLIAFIGIHAFFYLSQRQLMYFPTRERVLPEDIGLVDVEEVALHNQSGEALLSWFGRARAGKPTILFFHGNGGAVNHRAHRFRGLMAEGFGVFMLGYPGYGGSDGRPSERAFVEGAGLAYEYLQEEGLGPNDIVIYGESIGSGVAVQLATGVGAKGLVLEAPMSSAADVAREHYPWLLAGLLMKDAYRSIDFIDGIEMPMLVIHGENDRIIPIELGRKLFDAAPDPKTFVSLPGAGHNDLYLHSTDDIAAEFINRLLMP
ncbi:MAG: alpha/beta hydrolase [Woeseiaceae bacterium]|nr:alpha/beta hydrolase [Woeseiaceae bacterium]